MPQTKIATCCYCGSRAALSFRGTDRHELACGTCGAPVSKLKQMPGPAAPVGTPRPAELHRFSSATQADRRARKAPRKPRKTKSLKQRALGELWDAIEDIFD